MDLNLIPELVSDKPTMDFIDEVIVLCTLLDYEMICEYWVLGGGPKIFHTSNDRKVCWAMRINKNSNEMIFFSFVYKKSNLISMNIMFDNIDKTSHHQKSIEKMQRKIKEIL